MVKVASEQIITFLFSDIEHSTRLAQQLREGYPAFLEKHRSVIRDATAKHGGREIDAAGDGFFITFDEPKHAVLTAAEIQKKFHTEKWITEIGLKVRMGIHTGTALSTDSGYTGVEVHCASRICDAAYGGQILISQATQQYLEQDIDEKLSLSALGDYVFKDFSSPIGLYQLDIIGMKQQFPQPRIVSDDKRIAILPFKSLSSNPEDEYLGEGIAEELIMALGKVRGLRVVPRSSAFAIKDEKLNVKQIGQKLNVGSVLEGRTKVLDGQIRISIELVDANLGLNIWTAQYNSAKEHLVDIQDQITREIAEVLECDMIPAQHVEISHRQTQSAEAYDYYLRGRRFYLQFSNRGVELALQMFNKAIEADETYALAYAGIADCYSFQFQHKAPSQALLDKAAAASKRATELAPTLAEVYVSRGIVLGLSDQFEEAEKAFKCAIECDPTLFFGWFHYGRLCFATGRPDKAAMLFEQANRVEPEDYQSVFLAAQVYNDLGCTDLAQTLRKRGVEIADNLLNLNPGDTRALYLSANALVNLGQRERSLSLVQRALSLEPDDSMLLYNAACIYALLGMKPEALSCVEKSYAAGLTLRGWYENDSDLNSIRDHPRFVKLLEQMQEK